MGISSSTRTTTSSGQNETPRRPPPSGSTGRPTPLFPGTAVGPSSEGSVNTMAADLISNDTFLTEILEDMLIAVTGVLIGTEAHLFQNDITPTPADEITDFTEADYT